MRIAHFTRDFPPKSAGGISTVVGGLVGALERAGVESVVFSFDGWRPRSKSADSGGPSSAVRIERTEGGTSLVRGCEALASADIARVLRECAPSIVHVHDALLWPPACSANEALGRPAAYTVHVAHAHQQLLRGTDTVTMSMEAERRALAEADVVIAPSRAVADRLSPTVSDGGRAAAEGPGDEPAARAATGRLRVVPPGVDDDERARAATRRRERGLFATAPLSAAKRGPVVSLGRFGDVKGSDEWIRAIETIATERPDVKFLVAGGLPHNVRSERRWRCRFEAAAPSVSAPGWLDGDAVASTLAEASVFVLPSRFETFGLVALEASLFAAPIVATRCGGPEDCLVDGETARLCPPGDADALAAAVVGLLDDPRRAAELGIRAAANTRRSWTWDRRVEAAIEIYQDCLRG